MADDVTVLTPNFVGETLLLISKNILPFERLVYLKR